MLALELTPTITTSEIARTLDIPTTTVSTWRRRSRDSNNPFPARTEGSTDARPLFELEAVIDWYKRQFPDRAWPHDRESLQVAEALMTSLRAVSEEDSSRAFLVGAATLAAIIEDAESGGAPTWFGSRLRVDDETLVETVSAMPAWIPDEVRLLLDGDGVGSESHQSALVALSQLDARSRQAVVEDLTTNPRLAVGGSAAASSSEPLTELLLGLADTPPRSVLDPACGTGTLLLEAGRRFPEALLTGVDTNAISVAIAQCRAHLAGIEATFVVQDAFEWIGSGPAVDLVLIDPPIGAKSPGRRERFAAADPVLGKYVKSTEDVAWIALAATAVRKGGTGLVVAPAATLARGGATERARTELITRGQVTGVIALPGTSHGKPASRWAADPRRLRQDTRTPLCVWMLDGEDETASSILMVDGEQLIGKSPRETAMRICAAVSSAKAGRPSTGVVNASALAAARPGRTLAPVEWRPIEDDRSVANNKADALQGFARDYEAALTRDLPNKLPEVVRSEEITNTVPLGEVGQVFSGAYVRPELVSDTPDDGHVAYVGVGVGDERQYVRVSAKSSRQLEAGDVLVGAHGGGATVWHGTEAAVPNGSTFVVRPDPRRFDPDYLAGVLQSRVAVERGLRGTALRRIDPRAVRVPALPLEAQRQLVRELDHLEGLLATLSTAEDAARRFLDEVRDLAALGALGEIVRAQGADREGE